MPLHFPAHLARRAMIVAVIEGAIFAIFAGLVGGNLLTGFLLHLGATNSQIGLLAALPPLGALSTIFSAYLITRLPRRRPLMIGLAFAHRSLWVLAGLVPLFLPRGAWVWTYLVIYFVASLAASLAGLPWQSIMADTVPAEQRGRYFGIRNAAIQVATILAVLWASRYLDAHPGYDGFRRLYLVALGAGLLNVVGFFFQPEPPYVRREPEPLRRQIALPFRFQAFRAAVPFAAGLNMLSGMVGPFYGVQMIKELALSYGLIGQITAVGTATGIVAYLLLGRLLDRVGTHRILGVLPLFSLLVPLAWLFIGPQSLLLIYGVSILGGVLNALQGLAVLNLNFAVSPRDGRPIYLAVFSAVNGLCGFFAPILGGWITEHRGLSPLLWLAVGGYAALTLLWWRRTRPQVIEALSAKE